MSFAAKTKNELCAILKSRDCCSAAELLGILLINAQISINKIKVTTENSAVARRVFTLIKTVSDIHGELIIKKHKIGSVTNMYFVTVEGTEDVLKVLTDLSIVKIGSSIISFRIDGDFLSKECCRKSFIRGAFLGSGSMIDPEKNYHMEFVTGHFNLSKDIISLLNEFWIEAKIVIRKSHYVIYIKDGETIADILNLMGAVKTLMTFHNIRIMKEMRNNVNRVVNCETANIQKTVNSSMRQIDDIKKISERMTIDELPKELIELSRLRLENPDATLKDLGEMLSPPVSKSCVSHRMKRIEKIAEEI